LFSCGRGESRSGDSVEAPPGTGLTSPLPNVESERLDLTARRVIETTGRIFVLTL
jgi:hypothetical protein